jgi:hypothetical protein
MGTFSHLAGSLLPSRSTCTALAKLIGQPYVHCHLDNIKKLQARACLHLLNCAVQS